VKALRPGALRRIVRAVKDLSEDTGRSQAWRDLYKSLNDLISLPGDIFIKKPDNIYRLNAFLHETKLAERAFPDWTSKKQSEWAAERASNMYQNYNKLINAVRLLSRVGVTGTYIAFKLEMMRNMFHIARYGFQGLASGNKALALDGAKKLASLTAATVAPYALSAASMAALGLDDKDDEAVKRSVVPPWDRTDTLLYLRLKDGKLGYAPMSYLMPTAEAYKTIVAAAKTLNDENPDLAWNRFSKGVMEEYLGPGSVFGPMIEAAANVNLSTGGKLTYREGLTGLKERGKAMVRGWIPRLVTMPLESWKSLAGEVGPYEKTYSWRDNLRKLLAVRVRENDIERGAFFRMRDLSLRWREASSEASRARRKWPRDAAKRQEGIDYADSKHEEMTRELTQNVADWQRLGISMDKIKKAAKDARLPLDLRTQAIR